MPRGTIRYWAAAREAAGVTEEPYDAATLAAALETATAGRDDRFRQVLLRCSFVVDGAPVGTRAHDAVSLPDGGTVEVLPPFAGGAAAALSPRIGMRWPSANVGLAEGHLMPIGLAQGHLLPMRD